MRFILDLSIDMLRRSPAALEALLQGVRQAWA
jgi:hypothetical protein